MLAKIENGIVTRWPLAEHYVQVEYPNTSFSFPLSDDVLQEFGFVQFKQTDPPVYDSEFQIPEEQVPSLQNGVAVQTWNIKEKYSAEEKTQLIAQKEIARQELAQNTVRGLRNGLLSSSDWTQVADAPVDKAAWATYRQALRDIPQQEGFPDNVVWPVAP